MRRLIFALLLAAAPAQAVPIQTPTGAYSGGLYWLRTDVTEGLTHAEAEATTGMRHATLAEVCGLLEDFGFACPGQNGGQLGDWVPPAELASLIQSLGDFAESKLKAFYASGYVYAAPVTRGDLSWHPWQVRTQEVARVDDYRGYGHLLVSEVPEPATAPFVGAGLALLGAARRCRR